MKERTLVLSLKEPGDLIEQAEALQSMILLSTLETAPVNY